MMVKVDIYRKFTNALAVTVIVSVGWICYEVTLEVRIHKTMKELGISLCLSILRIACVTISMRKNDKDINISVKSSSFFFLGLNQNLVDFCQILMDNHIFVTQSLVDEVVFLMHL